MKIENLDTAIVGSLELADSMGIGLQLSHTEVAMLVAILEAVINKAKDIEESNKDLIAIVEEYEDALSNQVDEMNSVLDDVEMLTAEIEELQERVDFLVDESFDMEDELEEANQVIAILRLPHNNKNPEIFDGITFGA